VTITSVLHVATGALTFSAGLALAILMRRSAAIAPRAQVDDDGRDA
jgi:hypothetical protein